MDLWPDRLRRRYQNIDLKQQRSQLLLAQGLLSLIYALQKLISVIL